MGTIQSEYRICTNETYCLNAVNPWLSSSDEEQREEEMAPWKRKKTRKEGFLSNDGAMVVLSPHFPNETRGLAWYCLFVSICHPALIFFQKKYGIKIRHWESAFHFHSKPQFSSLLSSSDCFLHIQQPPRGQNRDLWCAHQRKGILSNNFATSEADLSTCLLNHRWTKVWAASRQMKKKTKTMAAVIFPPFNTAAFGLGLVPSQSAWWLNLPWCIGKASQ